MIAYNFLSLQNLYIREETEKAWYQNCLDKTELDTVNSKYPVDFYTPNFFIRIGLFILTTVILLFTFGLFTLLFLDSVERAIGGLAIFFGLLAYGMLEFMVVSKKHFRSGVDDALLWISACSFFGGISFLVNAGITANCLIVFIISCYYTMRFADRLMSVAWYVSLLAVVFFGFSERGGTPGAFLPFAEMGVSIIIYAVMRAAKQFHLNHLYSPCLQIISISALVSFYLSGNYYVVRELSNNTHHISLAGSSIMPFGWLFWIFTIVIPFVYVIAGIVKKDIVLLRTGLLLVAVIIFTVRHYYSVAPIEVMMTAGGILLIAGSYGLSHYLKMPKYGFSNEDPVSANELEKLQLESILLAQTFTAAPAPVGDTNFGGGSFGGGGASGDF